MRYASRSTSCVTLLSRARRPRGLSWTTRDEPVRDELAKAGRERIQLEQKLKDVGLRAMYLPYRILCAFVHPNLTSLIARHAGRERMTELEYLRFVERPVYQMLAMIAVDLLVRSASALHRFTDIDESDVSAVAEGGETSVASRRSRKRGMTGKLDRKTAPLSKLTVVRPRLPGRLWRSNAAAMLAPRSQGKR